MNSLSTNKKVRIEIHNNWNNKKNLLIQEIIINNNNHNIKLLKNLIKKAP
jgi:hypothetical protein